MKNVRLDTPQALGQHAQAVYQQAVVARTMPLNDATHITDGERALIGRWFEAGAPVQPVALRYGAGGSAQHVVAFAPRESFFGNFLRLLGEPSRPAEVVFLEPVAPGDAEGRRRIAETARERIVAAMET